MLSFAAFTPHPPIIIPEIGQDNLKHAQKTADAMKSLANKIEDFDIDTIVFISPHTTISFEHMMISKGEKISGSFANFDHPEISYNLSVDDDLSESIENIAKKHKMPLRSIRAGESLSLDHGVMVPYYYLQNHLASTIKIIIAGFSAQSRAAHFTFGQIIKEACQKSPQNIAVIASGDLSHRIFEEGSELIGKKFDSIILDNIKVFKPKNILDIDPELQEEAGECGYRSLLILLGALDNLKIQPEVLSYEAPFGVGYLVANFKILNSQLIPK